MESLPGGVRLRLEQRHSGGVLDDSTSRSSETGFLARLKTVTRWQRIASVKIRIPFEVPAVSTLRRLVVLPKESDLLLPSPRADRSASRTESTEGES